MTVKEGDYGEYIETGNCKFQLAKINPALTPQYYEYLIDDKSKSNLLQAWDLMLGVNNLSACINSLKKALNNKNGIPEPAERPPSDTEID